MRCRKVRSFLSAYCNDELAGRKHLAVREHLATCSDCRREAAIYQSMRVAGRELQGVTVSADFNATLLNRIASERFHETRTRAYLPKRAPIIGWRRLAPVVSVVAVLALVAVYWAVPGSDSGMSGYAGRSNPLDDLYLTVQPTNNPHVTGALAKDWSLDKQLRRSDRMARIFSSITDQSGFANLHMARGVDHRLYGQEQRTPFVTTYYRVQPIIRVYQSSQRTASQEDEEIY